MYWVGCIPEAAYCRCPAAVAGWAAACCARLSDGPAPPPAPSYPTSSLTTTTQLTAGDKKNSCVKVCIWCWLIDFRKKLIKQLEYFFGFRGHVALDRNPGFGYNTLLLRLIPGYLSSACPHRQFYTQPGLLHSLAALLNFYPHILYVMQGGILNHF